MSVPRTYCAAAARAIWELDRCSLRAPDTGQDKRDWDKARGLLYGMPERNGDELSATGGRRLKKRPVERP